MIRTWKMLKRDSNGKLFDTGFRAEASGAQEIMRKSGLDFPDYCANPTRRGYGHFAGKILVYDPITSDVGGPADFVLEVV